MRATRPTSSSTTSCRTGWCEMTSSENPILVLIDVDPSGYVASSTAALLGAASTIGSPVALIVGGSPAAVDQAAAAGASVVLTADGDPAALTVPIVDALQAAAAQVRPDAVLISNSISGRDVAGRFAVRTKSALSVDAVGVSRDDEGVLAHHSVYGGAYLVDSAPTFGPPVITVRQGAVGCACRGRAVALGRGARCHAVRGRRGDGRSCRGGREVASSRPELRGATRVVSGGRWPRVQGEVRARRGARRRTRAARRRLQGSRRRRVHPAIAPRSVRPGCRCRRSCMSRSASPERSSTARACRRRRTSSRSTRTPRRRS